MSTNEDSVRLAILRHCESSMNIGNRFVGQKLDPALTARGIQQAEATASYLKTTAPDAVAVYTSPLERARRTAEIIAGKLDVPLKIDLDLVEFDFGDLEGLGPEEAYQKYPEMDSYWGPAVTTAVPGGESAGSVARRASSALRKIASNHAPGETAIVVSHQGAITMGLSAWLGDAADFMKYVPENGGVTWIACRPQPEVLEINHTEHLSGLGGVSGR